MDVDWATKVLGVIAQHGPWALFCFYLAYKHFQWERVNAKTVEVMTAIKTLIEHLECQHALPTDQRRQT